MSRLEGLRKLKGLWFIGAGVLLLSAWITVFVYAASILYVGATPPPFYVALWYGACRAFSGIININPQYYAYNLWPFSGFAFTGIGLYRLIRSLFRSRI
jgi:hypothetical protein